MKNLKIGALALALVLAATCFAACNKEEVKDDEVKDVVVETTKEEDPNAFGLSEDVRFDGETFSLYSAHKSVNNSYIAEEETGALLNDAIYKRNELTKQRLGIELNFVGSTLSTSGADQAQERDKISSLILAGDTTYDVFINVQHSGMPGLIQEGMFVDWNEIPHIDFSKPWWYSNTIRDITFGGKVFCMTGDYNLASFSNTECLAFNKTLLDELELEYPYQMVFDGTWTHDEFVKYIQAATKDLNGDGQMDFDNDRYGFGGWEYEQLSALYVGYGGETLKKDDNNLPVLNIYSVHQNEVVDKMIEVFAQPGAFYEGKTYGLEDKMFSEGRLLFNDSFLSTISGMRNYEDEIGFIPYPKLNAEQEEYYSRTANISCLTYIPVTLDPSRYALVGAALETMAYYSSIEVLPLYFDTILTVQSTRDVESEQMIPIIKDSSRFMDQAIGFSPSGIVKSGQNTLASHWMSNKTAYEEKLADLIKTYE